MVGLFFEVESTADGGRSRLGIGFCGYVVKHSP